MTLAPTVHMYYAWLGSFVEDAVTKLFASGRTLLQICYSGLKSRFRVVHTLLLFSRSIGLWLFDRRMRGGEEDSGEGGREEGGTWAFFFLLPPPTALASRKGRPLLPGCTMAEIGRIQVTSFAPQN